MSSVWVGRIGRRLTKRLRNVCYSRRTDPPLSPVVGLSLQPKNDENVRDAYGWIKGSQTHDGSTDCESKENHVW